MPMLKTITGHTGCAGVMDYLRKGSKDDRRKRRMGEISEADTLRVAAKGIAGYLHDGHGAEFDRALAEDFVGIPPSAQGDWARYMDDLRRAAGCDRRTGGREGKAVTYRHYVLAPDPEDGIDLDTLRAYAKEWVVKAFGPGATAAIVYHDDNHERLKKGLQGIPHAHICINALNTQTGRKWHFAKDDLARQANVAQELAEKYSLAPLPKMRTSDAREDPLKTMRICRTKEECAMLAKGFVPYKESIRKAVAKACRTASSWDQFKAALADKGVSVTITRRGTLTYCDSNGRKAKEQKLGLNFGIVAVGEAIKRNSSESVSLPDVDATPATYDVSLVRRRGKVECRLGTERLVWHEEAGSRWQHLDNIKSLERAAKVKEIYGIVDGESYSRTLSHLNLQLEEAARNQDPAAARIRCEIKSVMYAQAVIDLASARKRIGDEAVLSYSESLLRQGRQLGVANIESIAAIARSNGIDRTEGWRAAVGTSDLGVLGLGGLVPIKVDLGVLYLAAPLRGLHRQHVLQPVDDDELPDLQVEQAAEVPLVEQLLPDEELGLALGFRVGVRADPLDLVVMAVDVRVQMVVAGHEGSDVDPLVHHGRVPVRAPRVRPPVHGHEGGVVLPVPQSPRHHRDVHDTAALFGLRSAHSASAAALLGQNSHIWDDE